MLIAFCPECGFKFVFLNLVMSDINCKCGKTLLLHFAPRGKPFLKVKDQGAI